MKRVRNIFLIFLLSFFARAQDSSKVLNHEIGFNTVTLLRQVAVFTPGSAPQLPYDVFYNLYYKDKIGFRTGLGILGDYISTKIEGQEKPRITNSTNLNLRVGATYNFTKYRRITFNGFADFIIANTKLETVTTTTSQALFEPVVTTKVSSSTVTKGTGGQVGFGIKFNLYKKLSIYAEVPLSIVSSVTKANDTMSQTGGTETKTSSVIRTSQTRITLPSTVYLVLRF